MPSLSRARVSKYMRETPAAASATAMNHRSKRANRPWHVGSAQLIFVALFAGPDRMVSYGCREAYLRLRCGLRPSVESIRLDVPHGKAGIYIVSS